MIIGLVSVGGMEDDNRFMKKVFDFLIKKPV